MPSQNGTGMRNAARLSGAGVQRVPVPGWVAHCPVLSQPPPCSNELILVCTEWLVPDSLPSEPSTRLLQGEVGSRGCVTLPESERRGECSEAHGWEPRSYSLPENR